MKFRFEIFGERSSDALAVSRIGQVLRNEAERRGDVQWNGEGEPDYLILVRGSPIEMRNPQGDKPWLMVDAFERSDRMRVVEYRQGQHHRSQRTPTREGLYETDLQSFFSEFWKAVPRPPGIDSGPTLLEPVSKPEHAAIEKVLGLLWAAASEGRLTEAQERMILSIAAMIEQAHRETVPGEDERWKLVGVVRGGLRYLVRELPEDVIKWGAAGVILSNIDWHNVAQALPG